MPQWLRRRRQAERLAQADAEALIRDHGAEAYREARQRERDVILPDGTTHAGRMPAHWRRVALDDSNAQIAAIAGRLGERIMSDALLPFPGGACTEAERHERAFPDRKRYSRTADS
jgi:hypothetical protein